jgi:hypothetical protein
MEALARKAATGLCGWDEWVAVMGEAPDMAELCRAPWRQSHENATSNAVF